MMPAKLYQVIKAGLTTVAPVLYMVSIDVIFVRTTRKAAVFVPNLPMLMGVVVRSVQIDL